MRLTEKDLTMAYEENETNKAIIEDVNIYNKLHVLEDIEEELGIDLITLFKALKGDKFYSKHPVTGEVSWIPLPELYYCNGEWNIYIAEA